MRLAWRSLNETLLGGLLGKAGWKAVTDMAPHTLRLQPDSLFENSLEPSPAWSVRETLLLTAYLAPLPATHTARPWPPSKLVVGCISPVLYRCPKERHAPRWSGHLQSGHTLHQFSHKNPIVAVPATAYKAVPHQRPNHGAKPQKVGQFSPGKQTGSVLGIASYRSCKSSRLGQCSHLLSAGAQIKLAFTLPPFAGFSNSENSTPGLTGRGFGWHSFPHLSWAVCPSTPRQAAFFLRKREGAYRISWPSLYSSQSCF